VKPNQPIPFSGTFNATQFSSLFLYGLSGVSMYPWPCCSVAKILHILFSNVGFFVNDTSPGNYICSAGIIPDSVFPTSSTNVTLFSKLNMVKIEYGNTYGSGSDAVCPYLFKNAYVMFGLTILYQVDSFLYVTLLKFQQVNDTKTINSYIANLDVYGYNYKLDADLLHPLVFEQTSTLGFTGKINFVQPDLFKAFSQVVSIFFTLSCLGSFYHQNGVEWMIFLKEGSHLNLTSINIPYNYPDHDFCIFAHLANVSHTQFDLRIEMSMFLVKQTFTAQWLCFNWWGYYDMESPCDISYLNNTELDRMFNLCNISGSESNQQEQLNSYSTYADYYQTRLISILSVELIPFVLIPCTCLIGLFLNWKIIRTLKDNEKKDLKEDFYKYMSANAKFNCLYCLIFVFYPMTSCTWNLSYHFCSSIYTTQFVQYYKIVMIAYLGEVVKMCANISYIMMTFNRYLLVGKDHAPWLVTAAKLEFKWVIQSSILLSALSALINIGHGWEYQAVKNLAETLYVKSTVYYLSNNYVYANGKSYSDYPEANKNMWYLVYSIVYFVINFGVFFIYSIRALK
jgi:hypothetical protein